MVEDEQEKIALQKAIEFQSRMGDRPDNFKDKFYVDNINEKEFIHHIPAFALGMDEIPSRFKFETLEELLSNEIIQRYKADQEWLRFSISHHGKDGQIYILFNVGIKPRAKMVGSRVYLFIFANSLVTDLGTRA